MKIILVIPTLSHGGAERVISELANSLTSYGHDVYMVLWIGGKRFYHLDSRVNIIDFGSPHGSKLDNILSLFKIIYKLRKLYRLETPDAVVSFLTRSNILVLLSGFFMDVKIYISERNSPNVWDNHSKIVLALRNFTYRYVTGFIAQTEEAKRASEERFGIKKSRVIPNPMKQLTIPSNIKKDKIILNVGRLEEQKGQKYLMEAFAMIAMPEWKLVILGEGSKREELEKYAAVLGIVNQVIMPGSVKNIDEWYAKASIFAFPSLYEGFPNALAEAMAAGLPCVSFDCDTGPRDLIVDGINGYLVPVGNVKELANRFSQLINDKNLRINIVAESIKIKEQYSLKTITSDLLNFINNKGY